jgi:long-chain acyl-CoA synthetase
MPYQARFNTLFELFETSTEAFAERPLFGTRGDDGWGWTSYREFAQAVSRARAGLMALGIAPGDRVAVISNNRLEWAVCAYATYTLGAVYVPMYEAQLDRDWRYILRDSGAKLCLVANQTIARRIEALGPELPALQRVIDFQSDNYRELMMGQDQAKASSHVPGRDDLATLIYTSGTTGEPKGVRLTHYNLAANASALIEIGTASPGDRSLAFLPWSHCFGGCAEINTVLGVGGSTGICDNTDKLLAYLPEVQPTMLFAVPRIWNRVYDAVHKQVAAKPKPIQKLFHAGLRAKNRQRNGKRLAIDERIALSLADKLIFSKVVARFGGKLRFAFSAAAALAPEVAEFIDSLGIEVYEGYGLTENSAGTTANWPGSRRIGSVGKPIPGVEIKLDKSASTQDGEGSGDGEIIVYGSGVMAGYHNQPEATAQCMTADGGLRTGDLGRVDADGYVYITGRVKELYKLQNGKYVAPAPLEEQLQLSPYIAQCVVYGSNLPSNVALIIPDMQALTAWAQTEGLPSDAASLLAQPRTRELIRAEIDRHSRGFKGYERISDFLLSAEEMTTGNDLLTPTLKVKRRNVMTRYGVQLRALYAGAAARMMQR